MIDDGKKNKNGLADNENGDAGTEANGTAHDATHDATAPVTSQNLSSDDAAAAVLPDDNSSEGNGIDADRIAELEKQLLDGQDKMLRVMADADNIKKRVLKDLDDGLKYAPQNIILELLPIFDNLVEVMKNITDEDKTAHPKIDILFKSLELILKMLDASFEKFSISKTVIVGQKFDPNLHQALSTKPASGDDKDMIAEVLQQGYQLHDRLIRPALVVVFQ